MPPTRFERVTPGLGILCSVQLSYGGAIYFRHLAACRPVGGLFCYHFAPTIASQHRRGEPDPGEWEWRQVQLSNVVGLIPSAASLSCPVISGTRLTSVDRRRITHAEQATSGW